MQLILNHSDLKMSFKIENYVKDMSVSEIHHQFSNWCEQKEVQPKFRFSESSMRKLLKTFEPVKGWGASIVVNPAKVATNELDRRIAKKEAKRAEQKAAKKAIKRSHHQPPASPVTRLPKLNKTFVSVMNVLGGNR